MGELYERLLNMHPSKDKISTDGLQACIRHFQAGRMTLEQIDTFMLDNYGAALGTAQTGENAGRREASDLLAAITNGASGTTTADRLTRIERMATLESVLVIADVRAEPFNTPGELRAVFGVPDRS
jgi:3-hydroxyacyl-CoA dehydrogenase